jgi:hypothetical protein
MVLLMHPLGKSIQRELDDFFQRLSGSEFQIRTITKGALTQARAKLKPEAFKELDRVTQESFYKESGCYTWDRYQIRVVDGSTMVLPQHESITREFGVHKFGPYADTPRSLARISLLYDPLNGITIDGQISGYSTSEKELCNAHLEHVKKGDLLIFDRLYAGFDLMNTLHNRKVDFLFRMKEGWWKKVREFKNQPHDDQVVDLQTNEGTLKVRLVKVKLENGEQHIFCTSVMGKQFTAQDFSDLYQSRWGIEETYKTLKNWVELENFSGKTALAIKQDFFSKIFLMNLCTAYSHPVAEQIKKEKENYQINRVQSLAMLSVLPIPLFIQRKGKNIFKAFDDLLTKTIDLIRPQRTFRRKKTLHRTKFSMNYKRL